LQHNGLKSEETWENFSVSVDHPYSIPLSSQQLLTDEPTSSNGLDGSYVTYPQMSTELGNDSLTSLESTSLHNVKNQEIASLKVNVGSSKKKKTGFREKCALCPKVMIDIIVNAFFPSTHFAIYLFCFFVHQVFTSHCKYKDHLASHVKSYLFRCPHCEYVSYIVIIFQFYLFYWDFNFWWFL
jgi:hypothetical protein